MSISAQNTAGECDSPYEPGYSIAGVKYVLSERDDVHTIWFRGVPAGNETYLLGAGEKVVSFLHVDPVALVCFINVARALLAGSEGNSGLGVIVINKRKGSYTRYEVVSASESDGSGISIEHLKMPGYHMSFSRGPNIVTTHIDTDPQINELYFVVPDSVTKTQNL